MTAEERFMSKVVWNGGEDECWTWQAATRNGYGRFGQPGTRKVVEAHRFAYELFVGPIPAGLDLDHTCHNGSGCTGGFSCPHRACVNPAHLEPVTHRENILRGNSPAALCATRTHCPYGHPYSGSNVYLTPLGARQCRACKTAATRKHREKELADVG